MIPIEYKKEKPCYICNITKLRSEFSPYQQKCKDCEDKDLFKCVRCKQIKERKDFPKDSSNLSGVHGSCKSCKNKLKRKRRYKNSLIKLVRMRFRDMLRRCGVTANSKNMLELGYTKEDFINKFPKIDKGYEVDHCIPLSWFEEGTPIYISCALSNLQLLDAKSNNLKKNFWCHIPSDTQYVTEALKYIKKEYLENF